MILKISKEREPLIGDESCGPPVRSALHFHSFRKLAWFPWVVLRPAKKVIDFPPKI